MGRGLSDLQKRILHTVAKGHHEHWLGCPWLDVARHCKQRDELADAILTTRLWRDSEHASVSRALHRLEHRGLIIRNRGKRRTETVPITPEGRKVVDGLPREIDDLPDES
jgi:hypothetical protein